MKVNYLLLGCQGNSSEHAACTIIKITGSDEDPFLNRARISCNLYRSFGEHLAPISVTLIIGKHHLPFKPEEIEGKNSYENRKIHE